MTYLNLGIGAEYEGWIFLRPVLKSDSELYFKNVMILDDFITAQ